MLHSERSVNAHLSHTASIEGPPAGPDLRPLRLAARRCGRQLQATLKLSGVTEGV
jgi:hypothetical protein